MQSSLYCLFETKQHYSISRQRDHAFDQTKIVTACIIYLENCLIVEMGNACEVFLTINFLLKASNSSKVIIS